MSPDVTKAEAVLGLACRSRGLHVALRLAWDSASSLKQYADMGVKRG